MFPTVDTETAEDLARSMTFVLGACLAALVAVVFVIMLVGAAANSTNPLIAGIHLFGVACVTWLGNSLAIRLLERSL